MYFLTYLFNFKQIQLGPEFNRILNYLQIFRIWFTNLLIFMKKQKQRESQYHEILLEKKHEFAVNHFIDQYNERLNKKYTHVTINKVFGQYVHTRMHMYHLITNNGDKITALLSIYQFQLQQIHGYVDYVHTGHMKPIVAQKKLIQLDSWPSCGAFSRCDEGQCDYSEAQNVISQHIDEINKKLEVEQSSYKIVKCWSQCVQGTNYFMHVLSNTGKKASIAMYVPLDYGYDDQIDECSNKINGEKKQQQKQNSEDEDLVFEITLCSKGHVSY